MQIFESATVKLTAWYLLIIMILSLTFSGIIYQISVSELGRGFPNAGGPARQLIFDQMGFEALREQRITEGKARIIGNLLILNGLALSIGGIASYFLARRTLEPIRLAMDEQGRFTSDASHELRTPLTAMRSEIEIALRNEKLSNSRMKSLLKSNLEEVNKLHALSDRLLQLSSQKDVHMEPVAIDDIAIDAVSRIYPTAQTKDIQIQNNVAKASILGNRDSLADLLTILLDNAIKYSDEHTTITISSSVSQKYVTLHVTDQGYGIKASELPHIFDRFYRADISRTNQTTHGHGLGLSIAQRIAQAHNSSLTVTSTVGKGSIFSIKLPREL